MVLRCGAGVVIVGLGLAGLTACRTGEAPIKDTASAWCRGEGEAVDWDDDGVTGISPSDSIGPWAGVYTAGSAWSDGAPVEVTLQIDADTARTPYVDPYGAAEAACVTHIYVPVTVRLATDDSRLDEVLDLDWPVDPTRFGVGFELHPDALDGAWTLPEGAVDDPDADYVLIVLAGVDATGTSGTIEAELPADGGGVDATELLAW